MWDAAIRLPDGPQLARACSRKASKCPPQVAAAERRLDRPGGAGPAAAEAAQGNSATEIHPSRSIQICAISDGLPCGRDLPHSQAPPNGLDWPESPAAFEPGEG